jgi:beta-aspartyl-peptidase (threonine type)
MKLVLAKWAADRLLQGVTPAGAARMAIQRLELRLGGHGGIILLDAQGRYGLAHNTFRMAWALKTLHQESSGINYSPA